MGAYHGPGSVLGTCQIASFKHHSMNLTLDFIKKESKTIGNEPSKHQDIKKIRYMLTGP